MGGNPVKRPTEAQLNTLYDHVGPRLRSFIKTKGDAQCLAEIREIVVFGMRELGIDCDLPIVTIDFAGTGTAMILWSEPPAVAIVANPATFFAGDSREGPFRCPVCNGNGQVSAGFYSQTSGMWSGSSTGFEGCRTCMQTGIVWR